MNIYRCDYCGRIFDRIGLAGGAEIHGAGLMHVFMSLEELQNAQNPIPLKKQFCIVCATELRKMLQDWWLHHSQDE